MDPFPSTVLLIDGEPEILKMMELFFAQSGCRLIGCPTPARGLQCLAEQSVDCVVLDIPHSGAEEWLRFLRAACGGPRGSALPVVATSASPSPHLESQVLSLGAARLIPKPYYPREILAHLRALRVTGPAFG